MTLPSIDLLLIAGRAVFLVVSFIVAAAAFVSWRRAAERQAIRSTELLTRVADRLARLEEELGAVKSRFGELLERTEGLAPSGAAGGARRGYDIAIRLARSGASCEQLMESCALSRQEADLVQRLHGRAERAHGLQALRSA